MTKKIKSFLFFLFFLIIFSHGALRTTSYVQTAQQAAPLPVQQAAPPCNPQLFYRHGDIIMDPYKPPLKDNKFYTQRIGLPINIPTSTVDANYGCVGILTRMGTKEQILPLFGRPLHLGRNNWQYYAMSDKNNNIKLPISNQGRSCTNEYGCDNISNGDVVYVEGYKDTFKATIYENSLPRYIPY